jgi:hypothetical protein
MAGEDEHEQRAARRLGALARIPISQDEWIAEALKADVEPLDADIDPIEQADGSLVLELETIRCRPARAALTLAMLATVVPADLADQRMARSAYRWLGVLRRHLARSEGLRSLVVIH